MPTATSPEVAESTPAAAVLPVGAFEQHGHHLPLTTDTLIASIIAKRLAESYDLLLLPPITISCSHEHADFAGTVSISATTLSAVVQDIQESLLRSGIERVVLVNAHGGNYVLGNIAQQANSIRPGSLLPFPTSVDWNEARNAAGMETNSHNDMHAGELETSILLAELPEVVRDNYREADHLASDRPEFRVWGTSFYSESGVIGTPSAATSDKGNLAIDRLTKTFSRVSGILAGE
jgi:creatinine amidohydrolase